ncbi:MAG: glycoside hydrolase family 3 protein [Phascolarctobacterium sp.]|nr:glycoside hydrolase family 3 protein [Phascolarctobacterium sp.]
MRSKKFFLLGTIALIFIGAWPSAQASEHIVKNSSISIQNIDGNTLNTKCSAILKIENMTLKEKLAQLFILTPEQLIDGYEDIVNTRAMTRLAFNDNPVSGIIYMTNNIVSPSQIRLQLYNMKQISYERTHLPPFLCIDEEGGSVARIGNNDRFDVPRFQNMASIGSGNNMVEVYNIGTSIGKYLANYGFNVDFAPVADIWTNPKNTVVRYRAFGSNAETVTKMAAYISRGIQSHGVLTCYKHFPGHGNTASDTHNGYAYTLKNKDELMSCELIPFIDGIKNKELFIMVGHISLPNLVGDGTPASLSRKIITDLLRNELGYDGLIITDALNMKAISKQYSADKAAVKAFEAGADILLVPENFKRAYEGMLKAVRTGKISEARINASLLRIVKTKLKLAQRDNMQ